MSAYWRGALIRKGLLFLFCQKTCERDKALKRKEEKRLAESEYNLLLYLNVFSVSFFDKIGFWRSNSAFGCKFQVNKASAYLSQGVGGVGEGLIKKRALNNKTALKGGGAYWKEGAKWNHYGTRVTDLL